MKACRIIIFAALLLVLGRQAPAVEKPCEFCHSGHGGVMTLIKSDPIELCSGCHAGRVKAGEHRVGMSPSMVVRDLPLHRGMMTCITCHDPHGKSAAMLRLPQSDLCNHCHLK